MSHFLSIRSVFDADSEKKCPQNIWMPNTLDIHAQKLVHLYYFVSLHWSRIGHVLFFEFLMLIPKSIKKLFLWILA